MIRAIRGILLAFTVRKKSARIASDSESGSHVTTELIVHLCDKLFALVGWHIYWRVSRSRVPYLASRRVQMAYIDVASETCPEKKRGSRQKYMTPLMSICYFKDYGIGPSVNDISPRRPRLHAKCDFRLSLS